MGSKSADAQIVDADEMTLCIWASGWGLPSIDQESLQLIAYIKFCGAPVTILECENPWKSPKGILPFFKHAGRTLYSPSEITNYLRQKNYNCDFGLSLREASEVIAYNQYLNEALGPALKYFCWVHESNYASVTRPCYTKRLPWIYKFWYTDQRKRNEALKEIEAIHALPLSESAEPDVVQKAQECITALADKLGNQEFFLYPNSPSALDAVIFSYLASFLKIPIPHSPVKDLIRATPNLERFVARVLQRYCSKIRGISRAGDSVAASSSNFGLDGHPSAKSEEVTYPVYQKVIAIAVGLGVMLAFAYHHGIVEFGVQGSSIEDTGNDDEDDENLIWE